MCTKKRVVVTGVGVISPVGNNKKEFWDALMHGKSGTAALTAFDPSKFTTRIAAEVKGFDPARHFSAALHTEPLRFQNWNAKPNLQKFILAGWIESFEKKKRPGILREVSR